MNARSASASKPATLPRCALRLSASASASSSRASTPFSPVSGSSGSRSHATSSARTSVEVIPGKLPPNRWRDPDLDEEIQEPVDEVVTGQLVDRDPGDGGGIVARAG